MKIAHLILSITIICQFISPDEAFGQASIPYTYKDVRIGAGGYVTGIIYSKAEQNLVYARTDVGGAYRWDTANKTWIPITDFLTAGDENLSGIIGLAADPSDANRVYLATGEYTASWAGNGAVFASDDKGNTWNRTDLSIKLGGNEDGRAAGERLQVDPNKGNILYLGTSADGLWKSIDYGATWNKVNNFPVATSTQGSGGISFVLFDKSSTTIAGNATNTIYVGVLQAGTSNFFQSTDAGTTWTVVPGASTTYMPFRAALASDGNLFLTYTNGPGPNGITAGIVYKYNTISKIWKSVTPPTGQGAFAGITVDAQNPSNLMVSTIDRWSPKDEIYRSTNGGSNWKAVLSTSVIDNSSAPYATDYTPHWIGDIQIDPFNSDNAWFITGYGAYSTINATAPDNNNGKITFSFADKGLEELVVSGLISPPVGYPLLSAVGDQDGFRHSDIDVSPVQNSPTYGSSSSLEFAQFNPYFVARTYNNSSGNWGSYSLNQGVSWTKFPTYPVSTTGPGSIAMAADGGRMVWSGSGAAVSYSLNKGISWLASSGISATSVVSDRMNPLKFYSYDANIGTMKVSTDGGVNFSSKSSLPTLPGYYQWQSSTSAVFGLEGNVWVTSGSNGLYFSTNSGTNFTKVNSMQVAYKVAFGKPATDNGYPAVYVTGKMNDQYGFYRSIDIGNTWVRVNDDQHQFFSARAFAADPNVFGRIYIGTSGRGIIYGSPASTECDTATSATSATITQNFQLNSNALLQANNINAATNDKLLLSPVSSSDTGSWYWIGPNGFYANTRQITLNSLVTTMAGSYIVTFTNTCGIRSAVTFTVSIGGATSVFNGETASITGISIYPNPTKGSFVFQYAGIVPGYFIIEIYNLQGKLVYKKGSSTAKTEIETSLARGEYLIKVMSDKKLLSTKLIVE